VDWRFISASVRGTSHSVDGTECQDAHRSELIGETLLCVVSDGAGSAPHSALGSRLACDLLSDLLAEQGAEFDRSFIEEWHARFMVALMEQAREHGLPENPRLFACTLVGAMVQGHSSFYFQIGDGAIVVAPEDEPEAYAWVFWPDQGEFESTTYFATDPDAMQHLRCEKLSDAPVAQLAVFTDGLQRLALHFGERVAHRAFFQPLFAELHKTHVAGCDQQLSGGLERFLDSPRVNQRTDDDKSLILATRCPQPAAQLAHT
jgi:hypothetical protein